jgi:hypothetical protein
MGGPVAALAAALVTCVCVTVPAAAPVATLAAVTVVASPLGGPGG